MWCREKCKWCCERFLSSEAEQFVVTLSTSLQFSSSRTYFKSRLQCAEWNRYTWILYSIHSIHRFTRAKGKAQLQTAQSVLLFRTRSVSAALSSTPLVLLLCEPGDKRRLKGEKQRQAESTEACRQRYRRSVRVQMDYNCIECLYFLKLDPFQKREERKLMVMAERAEVCWWFRRI